MTSVNIISDTKSTPVILHNANINININNKMASVTIEFTYTNPNEHPIESEFIFPNDYGITIDSFQFTNEDKTINGIAVEKEKARIMYSDAIASGKTATMLEATKGDILQMSLGNIQPKSEFKIKLSYIQLIDDTFVIPARVLPRYGSNITSNSYDLELFANIKMVRGVISVSPGFELARFEEEFTILGYQHFTQDFVIKMLPFKNDKFCMGEFCPKTNTHAVVLGLTPKVETKIINREIIFLIDRSGSMEGNSMELTKLSLISMLKKIPPGCVVGFIMFGSDAHVENTFECNPENINKAIKLISGLKADLGGTEILKAVKKIESIPKCGLDRHVVLITDGQVDSVNDIQEIIKTSNFKLHCVGIGNGVSTATINDISKTGRGKCFFVRDDQICDTMDRLLNIMISPMICDIKITCDANIILSNPEEPVLYNNELGYMYFMTSEKPDKILVSYTVEDSPVEHEFHVEEFETNDVIHKIIVSVKSNEFCVDKQRMVTMSVVHGLLTKFTNFIAIADNKTSTVEVMRYVPVQSQGPQGSIDSISLFQGPTGIQGIQGPTGIQGPSCYKQITLQSMLYQDCSPDALSFDVDKYLPQEINDGFLDIPSADGHLINITKPIGVNTIGSSHKLATHDLKSTSAPKFTVSPWSSTAPSDEQGLVHLQRMVDEAKSIMLENVERVTSRGCKLEDIDHRDDLDMRTKDFKSKGQRLKMGILMKNIKVILLFCGVFVVGVILAIIMRIMLN